MNKTLIIYRSKYGATESYAKHFAHELNANYLPIHRVKKEDILQADTLILGGSVYMGKLSLLKKILKFKPLFQNKSLYFFAVGLMDDRSVALPIITKNNPDLSLYDFKEVTYYPGVFDISKMNGFHRFMLKMVSKMLAKKQPLTSDEQALLEAINNPKDKRDFQLTETLIQLIKG